MALDVVMETAQAQLEGGGAEERAFETGIFHALRRLLCVRFKTVSQHQVVLWKELWKDKYTPTPTIHLSVILTKGPRWVKHQILGNVLLRSPSVLVRLVDKEVM